MKTAAIVVAVIVGFLMAFVLLAFAMAQPYFGLGLLVGSVLVLTPMIIYWERNYRIRRRQREASHETPVRQEDGAAE